ncbi:MAG: TMEM198/TM7SF3 family protein [Thermomicrobiales bacterium]|nr:MAG: TMEM198/TM7SF3 family protein [Thermomicrobiales bacterium]
MDLLVGIILIVLGAFLALAGLRVFFIALPIMGFIVGMSGGLALMDHLFDNQFLSTTTGIIVGIVLGIVGAIISYLFWYVAIILGAAFIGASLGTGLMNALNIDGQWLIFIVAVIGAVILGLLTVILNLPIYWVIVNTAFVGATMVLGGVLLTFNRIDRADLDYGAIWAAIDESWFWIIAWIVVAAVGIGAQLSMITQTVLPEEKWTKLEPAR